MLLQRFGPRKVLFTGLLISMFALWEMSRFDLSMTAQPIMVSGFVQGLGTGLLFAPLSTLAYVTLSPVHRAEGTVASTMFRSLGQSAGISVLQAALINQIAEDHSSLVGHVQMSDPVFAAQTPAMLNPDDPLGIQLLNGEVTRQASMIAYDTVFGALIFLVLLMVPMLVLLRSPAPQAAPAHVEAMD
jgi:DHA2 family multidrug resistance protein